jgi:hypothetical protein
VRPRERILRLKQIVIAGDMPLVELRAERHRFCHIVAGAYKPVFAKQSHLASWRRP